jgi:rhodanese-related sulfurtransferase
MKLRSFIMLALRNTILTAPCLVLISLIIPCNLAFGLEVMITPEIGAFTVKHGSKEIRIQREQDTEAMLEFNFARTARPCPPFCAQPMQVAEGIKTIGEVELVAFMQSQLDKSQGLLIDARTPDWHQRGTIPGSINVPYNRMNPDQGADEITIDETLSLFGAKQVDGQWNFSAAKNLVLWCNGPWCGQSPTAIRGLIGLGYPKQKIAYYRGGMQLWRIFGLPVVSPEGELLDE